MGLPWVHDWDNVTFLNKAKLTISGQITQAAILLLGSLNLHIVLNT
jgi:ATP-dependent DNA helicase RecG